jgi:hypothetical protein
MWHSVRAFFFGLLILSGFLVSCRGTGEEQLVGEWRIRMESMGGRPPPVVARFPASGALVFDGRIARYGFGADGISLPEGALLGRGYLAIDSRQPVSRDNQGIPFRRGPYADELEEMLALPSSNGEVAFEFAPKVSDYGLVLQGSFSADTVRGKWTWSPGGKMIESGTFIMWRVPQSSVTDSAVRRSERAARVWDDPLPDVPMQSDTAQLPARAAPAHQDRDRFR